MSYILVFDDLQKCDAYDPNQIANFRIHPQFSFSVKDAFDIAVIKLRSPVPNFKKVVHLPYEVGFTSMELGKGRSVRTIGRNKQLNGAVLYGDLPVKDGWFSLET